MLSQLHNALAAKADATTVGYALAVQAAVDSRSGISSLADVLAATNGTHTRQEQILSNPPTAYTEAPAVVIAGTSSTGRTGSMDMLHTWASGQSAATPASSVHRADVAELGLKSSASHLVPSSATMPSPSFEQLCQWANGQV